MCICIIIPACKQSDAVDDDLSRYYFPVSALSAQGMVYTYENLQDSSASPEVWRHTRKGPNRIESINYGFDEEIVQRQYDRIVDNGVVTDSLMLYSTNAMGQTARINIGIISPHRFPFQPGDSSSVWLTKMEWWQPEDSLHIVLERRRRFQGYTQWKMNGKKIPAVRFTTDDKFETEADGWTSTRWSGEEIYAQDIGLVYYKRIISENLVLEFGLERRE